ncbi:YjbF family lipoprotein [Roseomonas sp. HF4]|uniref:YjbF family lipoprotein n=1 Tax=Roseomonas sp. HF4 TaxID=2562313 RepID=UPI0010BFF44A|nr:YjbF family lipoprotein [Roseomonas sp. HF4]
MRGIAILCALLLGGCGNTTGADVLRVMIWPVPVPDSWFAAPDGREGEWDPEPPAAPGGEVTLALSLGSRQGVARLVQEEGERRMWRTAGGVVVATEGPRVVATAGLRDVLAATRFEGGADPLLRLADLADGEEVRAARVVDVMRSGNDPARMRFGLRLDCRIGAAATDAPDTLLVEERCRGAARFTNRFWADARSYAVFRSEQWVGEGLPPLVVEVMGPPPDDVIPLPR